MLNIDLRAAQKAQVKPQAAVIKQKRLQNRSLNRGKRIKELTDIVEGNRIMLRKLQATKSNYSVKDWKRDDSDRRRLQRMIQGNGDRFCQNPYFLHSVCTAEDSYYITLCKPFLSLEAENK